MNFHKKNWKPDVPISKGAAGYHEAVSHASYYLEMLGELAKLCVSHIQKDDVVVDFGAGTGVSAEILLSKVQVPLSLWLVDNSPSWLGKAYDTLKSNPMVDYFILEKKSGAENEYVTLSQTVGTDVANHVVSANTLHLISDLMPVCKGIYATLKQGGYFIFQSANVVPDATLPKGVLLVDDTVKRVHDIALRIVRADDLYAPYRKNLDAQITKYEPQRAFVFPQPRSASSYVSVLSQSGFTNVSYRFKMFKVKYSDWMNFLRVKRLQAGILPEIGGNNPTDTEIEDRDALITRATQELFSELEKYNELADAEGFMIGAVYVTAQKPVSDDIFLKGKNALITGGSRGIGKAIALLLAEKGANIIINYNHGKEHALKVIDEIKGTVSCAAVKADVANQKEVAEMFAVIQKEFGHLDIVVNNAGIIHDKTVRKMEISDWEKVISINLNGVFHVTKSALKILSENGRIINISSIIGLKGNVGQANYAASKAALFGFTKSLAKEVARKNITANVIAPGLIETEIIGHMPAEWKRAVISQIPLKRSGTPQEIAKVVAFLASPQARYITGQTIIVDGGMSL